MWEESGWITEFDPYGWFQWYCRFCLGRRCSDDSRQISRALGVMGKKGRWRRNLINKIVARGGDLSNAVEDKSISPKVRQLLQVTTRHSTTSSVYLVIVLPIIALGVSSYFERCPRRHEVNKATVPKFTMLV